MKIEDVNWSVISDDRFIELLKEAGAYDLWMEMRSNKNNPDPKKEQSPDSAAAPKPGRDTAVSGPAEGLEAKEKPSDD